MKKKYWKVGDLLVFKYFDTEEAWLVIKRETHRSLLIPSGMFESMDLFSHNCKFRRMIDAERTRGFTDYRRFGENNEQ